MIAKFIQLSPGVSVSKQLGDFDFAAAARLGFRSVINNRPDGEDGEYLSADEAELLSLHNGLEYRHIPVGCCDADDMELVEAFLEALEEMPGPVLAYCKSGTRSAVMWAAASAGEMTADDILQTTAKAGFDLEILREDIEARAEALRNEKPISRRGDEQDRNIAA